MKFVMRLGYVSIYLLAQFSAHAMQQTLAAEAASNIANLVDMDAAFEVECAQLAQRPESEIYDCFVSLVQKLDPAVPADRAKLGILGKTLANAESRLTEKTKEACAAYLDHNYRYLTIKSIGQFKSLIGKRDLLEGFLSDDRPSQSVVQPAVEQQSSVSSLINRLQNAKRGLSTESSYVETEKFLKETAANSQGIVLVVALARLGDFYYESDGPKKDLDAAFTYYQKAVRTFEQLGEKAMAQEAATHGVSWDSIRIDCGWALCSSGSIKQRKNELEEAKAIFQTVIAQGELTKMAEGAALHHLVEIFRAEKNYAEAEKICSKLHKEYYDHWYRLQKTDQTA